MSITTELLQRQIDWSRETFGPYPRTEGVLAHMASEIEEIRREPDDLSEWIDMMILAVDGAQRNCGASAEEITSAYTAKVERNMGRTWPDWRTVAEGQPIEHVREMR